MNQKKDAQQLLSIVSLSFKDKNIELDYQNYYSQKIAGHVRIAMVISLGLYIVFAFLDVLLFPNLIKTFHEIRFYIVVPFVSLVIAYTFHSSSYKYLQLLTSISVLVAAFGIIAMSYIGGRDVNTLYYVGLMLVFIFNYDFLKLRFIAASIVGGLIIVGYIVNALLINIDPSIFTASLFFLVSANIMGMVSAYFYESLNRQHFYSQLILEKEKQNTVEINLHLEDTVNLRTANLEKANLELTVAKEKAEESERLKSVFLATMSHELRTPLNAIIGFSQFIESEDNDPAENREHAQIINASGLHLLGMIENLLDITLIESGQIKVRLSEFLLIELLADVNNIISQEQIKLEKQLISLSFDPTEIKSDFKIKGDRNKIKQVLINLLKNALKYTELGEIKYWCEEILENGHSYLKFYVSDTGIGILEEKKEIIFDVFRQADDTHARKYGGVGIGLTIARNLVNIMGGEIGVDSIEGKGSTFYFTIADYLINNTPNLAIEDKKLRLLQHLNKKILVVEDDLPSYSLLEVVLKKWGFDITWAQNGQIALNILAENQKFDLILMDMNMPIMNGFEATIQIKKLYPKNIIIAQTAYAVSGDKEKALLAGCDDYISKPISVKLLETIISRFI